MACATAGVPKLGQQLHRLDEEEEEEEEEKVSDRTSAMGCTFQERSNIEAFQRGNV